CLKDVEVSGDTYTHTKENRNNCTIVLDTIINKGIVKLEILIIKDIECIGIAEGSVGAIRHKGGFIGGKSKLRNGSRIGMEINIDSNPNTLTFFVNNEEQKNFVTNIPNIVRIFPIMKKGSRALEYGKLWGNDEYQICNGTSTHRLLLTNLKHKVRISSLIVEELNKNIIQASVENVSQSDVKP
ncbi:MAG: hypothetical protein EZS28_045617, partial [Streblomastix strix]